MAWDTKKPSHSAGLKVIRRNKECCSSPWLCCCFFRYYCCRLRCCISGCHREWTVKGFLPSKSIILVFVESALEQTWHFLPKSPEEATGRDGEAVACFTDARQERRRMGQGSGLLVANLWALLAQPCVAQGCVLTVHRGCLLMCLLSWASHVLSIGPLSISFPVIAVLVKLCKL